MENKGNRNHSILGRVGTALQLAIIMSVVATSLWFLSSQNVRGICISVLLVAAVLLLLEIPLKYFIREKGRVVKVLVEIPITAVVLIGLTCVCIYKLAPTQLFYPNFDKKAYQELKDQKQCEEVAIGEKDERISGWILHNTTDTAPIILYFGGNGENSARRMRNIQKSSDYKFLEEYNIAIFDYPSYGKSKGTPSESTFKKYGLKVYDYIKEQYPQSKIVLWAYSIGTGVANYTASKRNVSGMALMAPYANGYDLYNKFVDMFYGPARVLVAFKMESDHFAKDVEIKPLILASKQDELVDYDSSLQLSKMYPKKCNFQTIDGIGHNDYWGSSEVAQNIKLYLEEVTK